MEPLIPIKDIYFKTSVDCIHCLLFFFTGSRKNISSPTQLLISLLNYIMIKNNIRIGSIELFLIELFLGSS